MTDTYGDQANNRTRIHSRDHIFRISTKSGNLGGFVCSTKEGGDENPLVAHKYW